MKEYLFVLNIVKSRDSYFTKCCVLLNYCFIAIGQDSHFFNFYRSDARATKLKGLKNRIPISVTSITYQVRLRIREYPKLSGKKYREELTLVER